VVKPAIELRELTVRRDGREVLKDATLELGPQDRLAVLGANGAGKTTLLRTIVGLERPERGEVVLFGRPCGAEADFRVQRVRIGFLFQDSDDQLFCPSVIEDVAFGPLNAGMSEREARDRAAETLDALSLGHLADRFAHRLSGGEKRLVCLAGLLAMRPDVLLLDEPTNGVDAANGERLYDALDGFAGAIVLVSHDQHSVARIATRAMVLSEGRLRKAEIHEHPHVHTHPHIHPA
jgi:cobalt/nickel transport system ATP-binding protein